MSALWITLGVLGGVLLLSLAVTLYCFFKIFYSPSRKPLGEDDFPIPPGEEYEVHREAMVNWIREARALPHRDMEIVSHDGLTLRGKYYECEPGAPIEILFHGYRGTAERDMSGGIARCFALGRSALLVDHRGSGRSDGHVITFGEKERLDAVRWVDAVLREIDPEAKIILTGISMGAATVMLASSMPLPKNVVGVLADCGYTSTKAIIMKVITDMGLPPRVLYPFVRLSARVFGGFDPDANAPVKSVASTSLPVIFFHGDADTFVPCDMSRENYEACASKKKRLVIIKSAAHGTAFPTDKEGYLQEAGAFFRNLL